MFNRPNPLIRAGQLLLAIAVILVAWMQNLENGLKTSYAPISFYARSRHGWMLFAALWMAALGALALSRAYALKYPQHRGAKPLVAMSVAIMIAGSLRAQQYFPWEGRFTVEGTLHAAAGMAGFLLFAYSAILIAVERRRWTLSILGAVFVAACAVTCAQTAIVLLMHQKPQYIGLEERVILMVAVVWFYALFPLGRRARSD